MSETDEHASSEAGSAEPTEQESTSRDRSTIKFPYGDLDSAVDLALAVSRYGLDCTTGQLAAALTIDAGSPTYRARLSAALIFGVVESVRGGQVKLSTLGRRLTDPQQLADAKVDAFLTVPLYAWIFELFDGTVLPGDTGLEAEIIKAGVAAKVARRARQTFARSADQAGFFRTGRTRLVKPSAAHVDDVPSQREEPSASDEPQGFVEKESVLSNALLAALFSRMLPAEGTEFSARERRRLFRALAVNLDVIYGEPKDGEIDPDALADIFKDKPVTPVHA